MKRIEGEREFSGLSCGVDRLQTITKRLMFGKLQVRPARPGEAERIAQIAAAVNINRYGYLGKGFLVYTLCAAEYRKRIRDGQHIHVFTIDKKIVGFVCGYDRQQFESYLVDNTLGHEPSIGREVQRLAAERGDKHYVFLDQIALLPDYQDRGLGELFFLQFCKDVRGPYYVGMVEGPMANPRIDYWRARGFFKIGHVQEKVPNRFAGVDAAYNIDRLVLWGIYLLLDDGFQIVRCRKLGGDKGTNGEDFKPL